MWLAWCTGTSQARETLRNFAKRLRVRLWQRHTVLLAYGDECSDTVMSHRLRAARGGNEAAATGFNQRPVLDRHGGLPPIGALPAEYRAVLQGCTTWGLGISPAASPCPNDHQLNVITDYLGHWGLWGIP